MNRRAVIAFVGSSCALLSGCLSTDGSGANSSADDGTDAPAKGTPLGDHFGCEYVVRPSCDAEAGVEINGKDDDGETTFESIGLADYPDPPTEYSSDFLFEFVREFEESYARNDHLCSTSNPDEVVDYGIEFVADEALEREGEPFVFDLEYSVAATTVREGDGPSMDAGASGAAVYAVDETGVARAGRESVYPDERPDDDELPDPVDDGELVACFD